MKVLQECAGKQDDPTQKHVRTRIDVSCDRDYLLSFLAYFNLPPSKQSDFIHSSHVSKIIFIVKLGNRSVLK